EVLEAARRVTGRPVRAVVRPRRPGDPASLVAQAQKARRLLGWSPAQSGLEEIVRSAWEWRQAHPHGFAAAPATAAPSLCGPTGPRAPVAPRHQRRHQPQD
ncbi:MAG: hypothetical protein AB1505_28820, partial [Candidatus Latescibacterota bacterium]